MVSRLVGQKPGVLSITNNQYILMSNLQLTQCWNGFAHNNNWKHPIPHLQRVLRLPRACIVSVVIITTPWTCSTHASFVFSFSFLSIFLYSLYTTYSFISYSIYIWYCSYYPPQSIIHWLRLATLFSKLPYLYLLYLDWSLLYGSLQVSSTMRHSSRNQNSEGASCIQNQMWWDREGCLMEGATCL